MEVVMRAPVVWTKTLDERLRTLREAPMTWDRVAVEMGLGRNTVLERARKIGARTKRRAVPAAEEEARDRPARPAGHPQTWGMINAGTVLEGVSYPYPVFL
jgi:hypothetical protein